MNFSHFMQLSLDAKLMNLMAFGAFGSIPIYYFTYGNWPLALKLQIGLTVLLAGLYVAFLSAAQGKDYGFGGGIILLIFFGIVVFTGLVCIYYWGKPAGPPGVLSRPIKWFTFIFIAYLALMFGTRLTLRYRYKVIVSLPAPIKSFVYSRLIKSSSGYDDAHNTLKASLKEEVKDKANLKSVFLLVRSDEVLLDLFRDDLSGEANIDYFRNAILRHLVETFPQTKYPKIYLWSRLYELISSEKPIRQVTLILVLKGLKEAGDTNELEPNFYTDSSLVQAVWEKVPEFRYGFWPNNQDQIQHFFEKYHLTKDQVNQIALRMANFIDYSEHALERHEILMYMFNHYGSEIDYSKGVLYLLTSRDGKYAYQTLLNAHVPEHAWKMKFYNSDLLTHFLIGRSSVLKRAKANDEEITLILKVIELFKSKGLHVVHFRESQGDVSAKFLKEKFGVTGLVDKPDNS